MIVETRAAMLKPVASATESDADAIFSWLVSAGYNTVILRWPRGVREIATGPASLRVLTPKRYRDGNTLALFSMLCRAAGRVGLSVHLSFSPLVVSPSASSRLSGGKSALVRERSGGIVATQAGRVICAAQPNARLQFGRFMHDVGAMISVSAIVFEDLTDAHRACFCGVCRRYMADELSVDWRRFDAERNPEEWTRFLDWRGDQVVQFVDSSLARACAGRHGLWTSMRLDEGHGALAEKAAASGLFDAWIGRRAVLTAPALTHSMRAYWQLFDTTETVVTEMDGRCGLVVDFGGWPDAAALRGEAVGAARAALPVNRHTVAGGIQTLHALANKSPAIGIELERLLAEYPRMVAGAADDVFSATRAFLDDARVDMFTRLAELNRIIDGLEELAEAATGNDAVRLGTAVRLLSVGRVSLLDAAEESEPIKDPQRQAT